LEKKGGLMALKKSDVEAMAERAIEKLITGGPYFSVNCNELTLYPDKREAFRKGLSEPIYAELKERGIAE